MERYGNELARNYFEASFPSDFVRPSLENRKEFKKFLYDKYILLRYTPTGINQIKMIPTHYTSIQTSQIISPSTSSSSQADEIYISERSGGVECQEVGHFIQQIGENRKVTQKDSIGPLQFTRDELEKQSKKMKRQFEIEDKKKQDQLLRGMIAMHEISNKRKQNNELSNQIAKEKIQEENNRISESKLLRLEEKSQKLSEIESRRIEKRKEMKLRKQFEWDYYKNPFQDYSRSKISYHQPQPTIYPPIPKPNPTGSKGSSNQNKIHYLFKLDKKGIKYAVS